MDKDISISFEIKKDFYEQLLLDDSYSDTSDIPDIFEEFHKNNFLRANAVSTKKYLTKNEADWKTRDSFSDEYKKTIEETRKDLGISEVMFNEEEAVKAILESKPRSLILSKPDLPRRKSIDYEPLKIEREETRRNSEESTTWKILQANANDSSFDVSPPVYNCYGQNMNHWLKRPDVSWKRVEDSRLKCESWFAKCRK